MGLARASYSGMRHLGEERALSAGQDTWFADEFEVSPQASVVRVEAEEVVDARGLDGEVAGQVGVSELRGRDGEGDAPGFAGSQLDPGEAGELLCRTRDADGVHPKVELYDGSAVDGTCVRDEGADSRGPEGLDLRVAGQVSQLVEGECMYEGLLSVESTGRRPVTDTMVRQVAYRAIQSGCCGYTYGAQGCWNAAWERDDGKSMWGDLPWYCGIDLPGAEQLGHLRRLYEAVGWHRLRPFMECFTSVYELNNTVYAPQVTASADMDTIVLYFGETFRDAEGESRLSLLRTSPYLLRWFDPRTGELSVAEEGARPIRGTLTVPARPDEQDWVLIATSTEAA